MVKLNRFIGISIALTLAYVSASRADSTAVFTLDGLSFVSFQDEEVLPLESGSQLTFSFAEPNADGSIPFTIGPSDVQIAPISLGTNGELQYGLHSQASGTIRETPTGREMSFDAVVSARIGEGELFTYSMPFTTETAQATNLAGNLTVEITGLRLVDGVWYAQLVGATVNKENAFPKPGTAVYTVLSGQFDQLPE